MLGSQAGVNDPRGTLAVFSVEYIKAHRPVAVVAENVAALPSRHRHMLEWITTELEAASYKVWWKILDTRDYGIPHRRHRWYLVAIREDHVRRAASEDTIFPAPLNFTVPLRSIAEPLPQGQWQALPPEGNKRRHKNVVSAYTEAASKGINPFETPIVVDMGVSERFASFGVDFCPCLTRSRAGDFGYWCSTKGGPLSIADMCRLQGFDEAELDWAGAGVTARQFAACLGNAMSVNVLRHLVPRVLYYAKLASDEECAHMLGSTP